MNGLILDLDNTLVGWNQPDATAELLKWLEDVKTFRLKTCIVSNNMSERVERFSRSIGVMAIAKAAKPRRRAFQHAMRKMGTHHRDTAVIGDQVFTDILGGNRLQLYTILVKPLAEREFWGTQLVRRLERVVVGGQDSLSTGDQA